MNSKNADVTNLPFKTVSSPQTSASLTGLELDERHLKVSIFQDPIKNKSQYKLERRV